MISGAKSYLYLILSLVLMCIMIWLSSSLIVYFKSGAEQDQPRLLRSQYVIDDLPEVKWTESKEQDVWTDFIRDEVAKSYLQSWKVLNQAHWTLDWSKMDRFFDEALIEKLKESARVEAQSLKRVCLQHNLSLKHLSLDLTVAVFEDLAVPLIQELVLPDGSLVSSTVYLDLQVKMVLQDGQWKVYNWHTLDQKLDVSKSAKDTLFYNNLNLVSQIKGVNYYPQKTPWRDFWTHYDDNVIEKDLARVKELGFNTVRIFLPILDFGRNKIDLSKVKDLDHFMNTALTHDLMVVPTLFDFPIGFDLWHYPSYYRQLYFFTERYKDHTALLAWNLKNEPDIDFLYHDRESVISWLKTFIHHYHQLNNTHPLTIGWANIENTKFFADDLDYLSFHHYRDVDEIGEYMEILEPYNRKIVIEEFGFPSGNNPVRLFMNTEAKQSAHINKVVQLAKNHNLGWMVWTLYDYDQAPRSVFGWKPWIRKDQKHFGLLNKNGNPKKAMLNLSDQL